MADAATPFTATAAAEAVLDILAREDATENPGNAEPEAQATEPQTEPQPEAQSQESETPKQEEEPPRYRVKVRGQEIEVALPELLKGYSRTEDYTAKTAEVARQREALQAREAEITARASKLEELLTQAPSDPVLAKGQKTDWLKLANENPAEYVQQRAEYDQRMAYWQQVAHAQAQAQQEAAKAATERGNRVLAEAIPDWADEGKRAQLSERIAAKLNHYGFDPREIAGLTDPRVIRVMHDFLAAEASKDARQAAEAKKVPAAPARVMQPGAARDGARGTSAQTQALLNRASTSSRIDDKVAAAMALLGES